MNEAQREASGELADFETNPQDSGLLPSSPPHEKSYITRLIPNAKNQNSQGSPKATPKAEVLRFTV